MNREIKFRGRRFDNNELVYGNLVKTEQAGYYIFNYHFIPAISCPSEKFIEVYKDSICEFTGLKDKNGVEIYENDTLKFNDGSSNEIEWVSKVRFKNGSFNVDVENQEYNITSIGFIDDETEYEVINGAS